MWYFIPILTLISLAVSRDNVRTVTARQGDNISFDFDLDGAEVRWYQGRDQPRALTSDEKFKISKKGSLTIQDFRGEDVGEYKAEVRLKGTTADVVFQLNVLEYEEVEAIEQEEYIKFEEGEEEEEEEKEEDPLVKRLLGSVKIRHNADFYNECYKLNTDYVGNDLVRKKAHSLSHCQLLCLEVQECTAFVYIGRCLESGEVQQCVLKTGDVTLLSRRYKIGYTAATLACLLKEDGRCYKSGYTVRPELPPLPSEHMVTHIQCQEECMAQSDCRAFSYNPGTSVCVHEKQAVIGHIWSDSPAVYTEKSCIRNTDRSCFTQGYEYDTELIEVKKAYDIQQCIWHCLNEERCKFFVFVAIGIGRKDTCLLKENSEDKMMMAFKGGIMGDIDCLKSKGEQGYYPGKKVLGQEPFDRVDAGSHDECERHCSEHQRCKAFTFHKATCSRYSEVPRQLESVGGHQTGFKESLEAAGGRKTSITCLHSDHVTKLRCPEEGQHLNIEYAMFGRDSKYVCRRNDKASTVATCKGDEAGATKLVTRWCQGKRQCEIDITADNKPKTNQLVHDLEDNKCRGEQYLKINYRCARANIGVKSTCQGDQVSLSCRSGNLLSIQKAVWGRQTNIICKKDKFEYCGTGRQFNYKGKMSRTENGRQCQRWDVHTPHKHNKHFTPKKFPVLIGNYCRNPDPNANDGDPAKRAWCFTMDPKVRKEECPVPDCNKVPCQEQNFKTTTKIIEKCEGKASCSFQAATELFGDPCPHIPKYLELYFACEATPSTLDYDTIQPRLDPAKVYSVSTMLDTLPSEQTSECHLQNIDYDGEILRQYEDTSDLKDCTGYCTMMVEGCNLSVLDAQQNICYAKKVDSFIQKDVAGVISARQDCFEADALVRRKRSAGDDEQDSEVLNYEDYLEKTMIGYKPKPLFDTKIPRKQAGRSNMRGRESEYHFRAPHNKNVKDNDDVQLNVIDNADISDDV